MIQVWVCSHVGVELLGSHRDSGCGQQRCAGGGRPPLALRFLPDWELGTCGGLRTQPVPRGSQLQQWGCDFPGYPRWVFLFLPPTIGQTVLQRVDQISARLDSTEDGRCMLLLLVTTPFHGHKHHFWWIGGAWAVLDLRLGSQPMGAAASTGCSNGCCATLLIMNDMH